VTELERTEEYECKNLRFLNWRADYPLLVGAVHWEAVLKERARRFPDKYND
jgi:hypothetical protein